MAKVIIGHRPELTAEGAMEVFQRHFHDKYDVYKTKMPAYDFVVKKSAWRGVSVKLRQKRGQTYFEFMGTTPSTPLVILSVLLWAGWFILCLLAVGEAGGGAGAFIGFFLLLFLGIWLIRLPFSRPSRKIEKEVKALIEKAEEFKQPAAARVGAIDTEAERK